MGIKEVRFLKKVGLVSFLSFAVLLALIIQFTGMSKDMYSQQAASRWQGENNNRYMQNSVFFSDNNQITKTNIQNNIETLQKCMAQEIGDYEADGSIFAFSGESELAVKSEHISLSLNVIGVGGDYFFFHPLKLKAGSYMDKADLRNNIAILDEQAAWELFGSTDIVGKQIEISENDFIIVGVVEMEGNQSSSDSTREEVIFLEFSKARQLSGMNVQCFETVMREPMNGYSRNLLGRIYSDTENEIITNTQRFSFISIIQKMKKPEKLVKQGKAIAFPYYENSARMLEYRLIGKMRNIFIVGSFFLATLTVLMIKLISVVNKIGLKEMMENARNCFKKHYKRIRQKCESNKKLES